MENNEFHENESIVNEESTVIEQEVPPAREKRRKSGNGSVVVVMLLLFAVMLGFSVGKLSEKKADSNSENQGEIYNNIIKTMSLAGNENAELTIKDIAKLTENSVVEISTETVVRGTFLGQFISEGGGSGVVLSSDGYIVTNYHVIDDARKITVKLRNGEEYEATLIGKNSEKDIAVLKIEKDGLQPVVLGDSSKLEVGDTAVVIGNPLGSLGGTVTNGIISALDREIDLGDTKMNLLQTNAAVNPGNSGGGLFNGKGELVGIVVAKSAGSDIEGIGFAIPINDIKDTILELKDYGYVRGKVQLGVVLIDVTSEKLADLYRVEETGVYVQSVMNGSDGDVAGVKAGDRIVSFAGTEIKEAEELKGVLAKMNPGDTAEMVVSRNGRKQTLRVKLSEYKGE
ncbi:MAG: trypsin-like peptidase domain-containing protein [Clostridia bacterium]|nr:trypsin-like peptidase domain-containing protein [Clostridia bacterium]